MARVELLKGLKKKGKKQMSKGSTSQNFTLVKRKVRPVKELASQGISNNQRAEFLTEFARQATEDNARMCRSVKYRLQLSNRREEN